MQSVNLDEFQKNIVLIIPAYEPDDRFIELLGEIRKDYTGAIVVVNDGSGSAYDHYYFEAESFGCVVLKHAVNQGKGRALKNAFNYCLNEFPDLCGVVTADSDGQHLPEDIFRIMKALYDNQGNLILGCRNFSQEDVPFKSKLGNVFTIGLCKYMCGVSTADTQTGLRGIPKAFMEKLLNVKGERFDFETRMLMEAKDSFPIKDITIQTVYESKDNHQSHYDPFRDSIRIGKIFAEMFCRFLFSSLSSTFIDLALFNLLCPVFKPFTALYYVTIATALARIISATYNYLINYKLVFKSNQNHTKSAIRYIALAIVQGSISALLITLAVSALPGGNETVMKAIIDVSLFFVSYLIQRKFVF